MKSPEYKMYLGKLFVWSCCIISLGLATPPLAAAEIVVNPGERIQDGAFMNSAI